MRFEQLELPFAAIAADIVSGEMVVMNDGEVKAVVVWKLVRLAHKAHILEFSGAESYRFRQRLQRQQGEA